MSRAAIRALRRVKHELRFAPPRVGYTWGPKLMSELRKRWVLFRHPHATIRFGKDVYLGPGFGVMIPASAELIVGDGVEFRRGFRAEVGRGGRVVIGAGTRFTYNVVIQCAGTIEVGKRCLFAQSAAIFDGSHRFRDVDRPVLEQGYDLKPIVIGDDVVISSNCTVIASIGRRAFIGANAVVARDLPPCVVAVGAPARPIERFGPAEEEASGAREGSVGEPGAA